MESIDNFYCEHSPNKEFSIKEWNTKFRIALELKLGEKQTQRYLNECRCDVQCERCASIVEKRKLKTEELIKQMKNKC